MPINYRPSEFAAPASAGGAASPFSGTNELGQAGLSANLQSQLAFPEEFGKAHAFSRLQMDAGLASPSLLAPGPEAHAMAAMPGAETHALSAVGASDPISPMIQLIMKLPGVGAISSFFEALTALFMPGPDLFSSLDFSSLATHAHQAVASLGATASEHLPIDLSLLPSNAPILTSLQNGLSQSMTELHPLASKLGMGLSKGSIDGLSANPLYVSGQLDLSKAQFESGFSSGQTASFKSASNLSSDSQLISGPSLSDNLGSGQLAGAERLFSDRINANASNSLLSSSGTGATASQTTPLTQSTWPSAMHVSANSFGQEVSGLPAVGQLQDGLMSGPSLSQNVGFHLGSAGYSSLDGTANLGPSGAVCNQLGGRSLLASDSLPTFRPTTGGLEKSITAPAQDLASKVQDPSSLSSTSHPLTDGQRSISSSTTTVQGLKAKALSLKGFNNVKQVANQQATTSNPVNHHNLKVDSQLSSHSRSAIHTTHDQVESQKHSARSLATSPNQGHSPNTKELATTHSTSAQDKATLQGKHLQNQLTQADNLTQSNTNIQVQATDHNIETGSYTIQKGDTLWDIAKAHTGTGLNWKEIYKINHDIIGKDPNLIHSGTTIKLPGSTTDIASASSETTKYVIAPGDNLWDIAKTHLGGGEHWGEIYKLNSNVIGSNPRLILPGQELTLPGNSASHLASSPSNIDPLSQVGMQQQSQGLANNTTYVPSNTPPTMTEGATSAQYPIATPELPPASSHFGAPSFESPSIPTGHRVLPASSATPPSSIGADGAQAAQLSSSAMSAQLERLAPTSLRPDLSFLDKKPGQIR